MKLGSILKLAKGGLGPDEMGEMLAAAGIDVSFTPVAVEPGCFRLLAERAAVPGAKLVLLKGKMKGGETITALMVVNQGCQ